MANKDRNFIGGSAKMHIFDNNSTVVNCFLKIEDLNKLPVTENGYIRFVLAERKEPDQFGNTHYAYEDDWKPSNQDTSKQKGKSTSSKAKSKAPEETDEGVDAEDMPF